MSVQPLNDRSFPLTKHLPPCDDLDRDVYTVLGVPVDVVEIEGVLDAIDAAAERGTPFLVSTPNLSFLITSKKNREFKESLLMSDLCPADGMPIIWIARLLGLPIRRRVPGSDIFEALKSQASRRRHNRVFFFGGEVGVAAAASARLNDESTGLRCAGALCPGFGRVEDMSSDEIISAINVSGADFLLVALGAVKGQEWLRRNHHRLTVPVRSHLGAVMNFQARTVKRAPPLLRRVGFEWLWRIKEEPQLWRRYWRDGRSLTMLMVSRVLVLALATRFWRYCYRSCPDLCVERRPSVPSETLKLSGSATAANIGTAVTSFRSAVRLGRSLTIDLSETQYIDGRFFGLLLMVRKMTVASGGSLRFVGASASVRRMFRLHDLDFLLTEGDVHA